MSIAYSTLKKTDFHYFSFRYHLQLHWSCWRAVPAHLGLWMNRSWWQYYFYMCMYVYCLFYFEKNIFSLLLLQIPSAAALKLLTSCSSTSCVVDACNMVFSLIVLMISSFSEKKQGKKKRFWRNKAFFITSFAYCCHYAEKAAPFFYGSEIVKTNYIFGF